ncbi:MAG: hypothetical protein SP1CHLAM54_17810 [Chlamydiia bacterium]|nr:hypothetical protein [Chlamydiia bacterium]MCH9616669.1 hypothetical protein [Chlamydiia bacterium]MCH9629401.1 hypothetical protein [Chlamydiia bacterium]
MATAEITTGAVEATSAPKTVKGVPHASGASAHVPIRHVTNAMYAAIKADASAQNSEQNVQAAGLEADQVLEKSIEKKQNVLKGITEQANAAVTADDTQKKLTDLTTTVQELQTGISSDETSATTIQSMQIEAPSQQIAALAKVGRSEVNSGNVTNKVR